MKIAKTGYEIDGFYTIANLVSSFFFFSPVVIKIVATWGTTEITNICSKPSVQELFSFSFLLFLMKEKEWNKLILHPVCQIFFFILITCWLDVVLIL